MGIYKAYKADQFFTIPPEAFEVVPTFSDTYSLAVGPNFNEAIVVSTPNSIKRVTQANATVWTVVPGDIDATATAFFCPPYYDPDTDIIYTLLDKTGELRLGTINAATGAEGTIGAWQAVTVGVATSTILAKKMFRVGSFLYVNEDANGTTVNISTGAITAVGATFLDMPSNKLHLRSITDGSGYINIGFGIRDTNYAPTYADVTVRAKWCGNIPVSLLYLYSTKMFVHLDYFLAGYTGTGASPCDGLMIKKEVIYDYLDNEFLPLVGLGAYTMWRIS